METAANKFPWKGTQDEFVCNCALGHLYRNLPGRLTIDGRIHAETYISAVGAIAGYAAQRTLFCGRQPGETLGLHRATTTSGAQYWFGDPLNDMLAPTTEADSIRCVWSLAAGGALGAGLKPQQLPKLDAMFAHVASTIGGVDEGKSSLSAKHQAQLGSRDLLKMVWPLATMCFSGKIPNAKKEFGEAPVFWWSAIAAQASSKPVQDVKSVLAPDIALTLLMETAIYCSKLDQSSVEAS